MVGRGLGRRRRPSEVVARCPDFHDLPKILRRRVISPCPTKVFGDRKVFVGTRWRVSIVPMRLLRSLLEVHNALDVTEGRQSLGPKRTRDSNGRLEIYAMEDVMAFVTCLKSSSKMTFGFWRMKMVFAILTAFADDW